jgi:hypothetical protein
MAKDLKRLTDWLIAQGIEDVAHTNKTYLAHLVGVYRDLEAWGCPEDVCRAGMFHSIYGTELFQGFKLPLEARPEVQGLVGARAEQLGFINCMMDRSSFDGALDQSEGPYRITNRISGEPIELPAVDFDDLCRVHLCDWLEQVPRAQKWGYRRAAYQKMADRLGGVAKSAFERVFSAAAS